MGSCNCVASNVKPETEIKVAQIQKQVSVTQEPAPELPKHHGKHISDAEDNQPANDEMLQLVQSTIGATQRVKLPKILMKTGGSYEGEWINGVRDGMGTHVCKLENSRHGGKEDFTLESG